jgi:hypothetical protein
VWEARSTVVLRKSAWIAWGVRPGCKKTADETMYSERVFNEEGRDDILDFRLRGTLCLRWYKENRSNEVRGGAAMMKLGTWAKVQ